MFSRREKALTSQARASGISGAVETRCGWVSETGRETVTGNRHHSTPLCFVLVQSIHTTKKKSVHVNAQQKTTRYSDIIDLSLAVHVCISCVHHLDSLAIYSVTAPAELALYLLALSCTATKSMPSASNCSQSTGRNAPVLQIGPEERAFVEIQNTSARINRSCLGCPRIFLFTLLPYRLIWRHHPCISKEIAVAKAYGCFIRHHVSHHDSNTALESSWLQT
jgi:hypothetical protein